MTANGLILKNILCLVTACIIVCWQGWRSIGILTFIIGISLLGGARTNLLALAIALCTLALSRIKPKQTIIVLMVLWTAYVFVMWVGVDAMIHNPLSKLLAEKLRSFQERLVVWGTVTDLYHESPWWGMGPYSVSQALRNSLFYVHGGYMLARIHSSSHNMILELKACLGSVGLWIFWAAVMQQMSRLRHRQDSAVLLAVGVYGMAMLSGYLSFFRDVWFLGGIGLIFFWRRILTWDTSGGGKSENAFGRAKVVS